jgi:hypothetical protein
VVLGHVTKLVSFKNERPFVEMRVLECLSDPELPQSSLGKTDAVGIEVELASGPFSDIIQIPFSFGGTGYSGVILIKAFSKAISIVDFEEYKAFPTLQTTLSGHFRKRRSND